MHKAPSSISGGDYQSSHNYKTRMNYKLLIELYKANVRQGPGGDEQTLQALHMTGLVGASELLHVADIGCGTGASTLTLAENLNAQITAVDLFQDFLDVLNLRAQKRCVADKINTLVASMDELPFEEASLDLIWAEASIYNMGFEKGVKYLRHFLKTGAILAVSEITWLTQARPEEIQKHWDLEYPEIATASDKTNLLESSGFILKGYFSLPTHCWIENYYTPLEDACDQLIAQHPTQDAKELIEAEKAEIALYKKYADYYSYGFYIAQKS